MDDIQQRAPKLPPLRKDLHIKRNGHFLDGAPAWLVVDPITSHHIRLDRRMLEILDCWQPIDEGAFRKIVAQRTGQVISSEEVGEMIGRLHTNRLLAEPPGNQYQQFYQQAQKQKEKSLAKLFKSMFFFRIPLGRPQAILDWLWPLVAPLYSRGFAFILCGLFILGMYLVSHQWDVFTSTFWNFLTVEGLITYAFAIIMLKFLHELGHGLMARRYGIQVPRFGMAFMVFMPILYTETTEAWRLDARRHRMAIGLGGILVELVIAVLALLVWVFIPEGPARSIAFTFATVSWMTSLAVNLNPLMRFDGYYIVSDWLGVENMQERGFAFGRWHLRKTLFGLSLPAPELLPAKLTRILILYAYATWIYRLMLYLSIAALLYFMSFKVLGITLFVLEIFYFVFFPLKNELKIWWQYRDHIKAQGKLPSRALILCTIIAIFFVPWSGRVDVPTVMTAGIVQTVFAGSDGELAELSVKEGERVSKGQFLAKIKSVDHEYQMQIAHLEKDIVDRRLKRTAADSDTRSLISVLLGQQKAWNEKLAGLQIAKSELELRATINGTVHDMSDGLAQGLNLSSNSRMFTIVNFDDRKIEGYVKNSDRHRISEGDVASFIFDEPRIDKLYLKVLDVSTIAARSIQPPILADINGGKISSSKTDSNNAKRLFDSKNDISPRGSWYKVRFRPANEKAAQTIREFDEMKRGVVVVAGSREAIATRVFKRIASVLIRESGL